MTTNNTQPLLEFMQFKEIGKYKGATHIILDEGGKETFYEDTTMTLSMNKNVHDKIHVILSIVNNYTTPHELLINVYVNEDMYTSQVRLEQTTLVLEKFPEVPPQYGSATIRFKFAGDKIQELNAIRAQAYSLIECILPTLRTDYHFLAKYAHKKCAFCQGSIMTLTVLLCPCFCYLCPKCFVRGEEPYLCLGCGKKVTSVIENFNTVTSVIEKPSRMWKESNQCD